MFTPCADARGISGPARVVDGDTLRIGKTRVRLHGMDAPETGQTCTDAGGTQWACGAWVTRKLRARIGARHVTCEAIDTDRYGRMVARCAVAGRDLGHQLVRDGLAVAYRKYSVAYDADERAAAAAGRGLHGHRMMRPAGYRRAQRKKSAPRTGPPDPACAIKGNIARSGTRIYHLPGQVFYARTVIRPGRGERWFCTGAEARAAGWRPAKR